MTEFVALSERNYNEMESKLNVGTIVGIVIASLMLLILLITYATRRYVSWRKKVGPQIERE